MALRFVPEGENRPLAAIEAAEAWAANPTKEDQKAAARAASAAIWAASAAIWAASSEAVSHEELCAKIRKILSQPWKES
jgi:predicted S18 family serine protease